MREKLLLHIMHSQVELSGIHVEVLPFPSLVFAESAAGFKCFLHESQTTFAPRKKRQRRFIYQKPKERKKIPVNPVDATICSANFCQKDLSNGVGSLPCS